MFNIPLRKATYRTILGYIIQFNRVYIRFVCVYFRLACVCIGLVCAYQFHTLLFSLHFFVGVWKFSCKTNFKRIKKFDVCNKFQSMYAKSFFSFLSEKSVFTSVCLGRKDFIRNECVCSQRKQFV